MKLRVRVLVLGMFGTVGLCLPASAHHGGAAYDHAKSVTLTKATVTSFKFINPHVQIYFDVLDDQGNVVHWACESPDDPAMLSRQGWNRNILKPGDQVTIVGHPAKSGAKVVSLEKILMPDGRELDNFVLNN